MLLSRVLPSRFSSLHIVVKKVESILSIAAYFRLVPLLLCYLAVSTAFWVF
jgi:hypothetical protein